jgi:hypothetical protein
MSEFGKENFMSDAPVHRLSDRLRDKMKDNFGPEDPKWYQFIMDHKQYLLDRSKRVTHTVLELVPFRYKPDIYFVKKCMGKLTQTWIFCMLNDMRDETDFNESRQTFLVPDVKDIEKLRATFDAAQTA